MLGCVQATMLGAAGAAVPWYLAGGVSASNCVVAYQPKGAADYASSKINLANPGTYNAADGTAYPTWNATTGWTFNGSTQYLDSGAIPGNNQNWSAIVAYTNYTAKTIYQALFGTSVGGKYFAIELGTSGDQKIYYENGSYNTKTVTVPSSAVLCIAGNKAYRDGTDESISIPSSTGSFNQSIWLGYYHVVGSSKFSGTIQALAFYDTVLTATQVSAITTAMKAL